jgi:hypothetical protein
VREDAVVLIVVLIHCKKSLSNILRDKESKVYNRIYEFVNYNGYRNCAKYLGKDSMFIQYFTPV